MDSLSFTFSLFFIFTSTALAAECAFPEFDLGELVDHLATLL